MKRVREIVVSNVEIEDKFSWWFNTNDSQLYHFTLGKWSTLFGNASSTLDGLMTKEDKEVLDSLSIGSSVVTVPTYADLVGYSSKSETVLYVVKATNKIYRFSNNAPVEINTFYFNSIEGVKNLLGVGVYSVIVEHEAYILYVSLAGSQLTYTLHSPKKYIECSYNTINSEWSGWVTTNYDAAGAILDIQNWVNSQIALQNAALSSMQELITTISNSIASNFNVFEASLNSLSLDVTNVKNNIAVVNDQISLINNNIVSLTLANDNLNNRVFNLETNSASKTWVNDNFATINDLNIANNKINTNILSIQGIIPRVETLEEAVAALLGQTPSYMLKSEADNTYATIGAVSSLEGQVLNNSDEINLHTIQISELQNNNVTLADLDAINIQIAELVTNINSLYEISATKTELNITNNNLANLETRVDFLEDNKADKATTLEGYGIIDAYTKTEVDNTYETIENVDLLEGIVTENTEAIENLQSNKADKATTLEGYGITDTPSDNKTYGRKNGGWSEIDTSGGGGGITDAPLNGLLYGRQDGDWEQIVTNGITDAPIDGTPYSRQDGDWVVAETGIEDAPNDGEVYGRKNNLWEVITTGGGGTGGATINTTWSALVNLRDNGQLVPGQSYRITDYMCTTITTDTRSANNQFDIIVTALDEGVLSENASATYHEDDNYFSSNNANLESWELKYCLNNDTNRFDWADNVNGKGVIYYMKDNYNNELPYDFKNIQYLKNGVWVYTFGGGTDNSLSATCFNNKINPYLSSNKQTLNNIKFGNNCQSNTFGVNCHSNTFGDNCGSNTFGNDCRENTFGNNCRSNTFGEYLYLNTFGDSCDANTFGYSCYSNTFGNDCNSNTFGDSCHSNTFGNDCSSNTFGDSCYRNNFYHGSSGTTPKNYIRYITLEDGIKNNNFYSDITTTSYDYLQRIRIKGLENTTTTDTTITLSATNTKYEWVICYTSGNVLKQYCPND